MTDHTPLCEATDEQLQAEAQRRVDRGDRSPNVYMTTQQCDHKARLGHLRAAVIAAWVADPSNPVLGALSLLCDRLDTISGNPITAERVHAINTTFYGRLAQEEHRPGIDTDLPAARHTAKGPPRRQTGGP